MDILFVPLLRLLSYIISFYTWAVILSAILSWLIFFNVFDRYNRFVYSLQGFLFRITEPLLAPLRRFLPDLGGFDVSPLILLFILHFLSDVLIRLLSRFPA